MYSCFSSKLYEIINNHAIQCVFLPFRQKQLMRTTKLKKHENRCNLQEKPTSGFKFVPIDIQSLLALVLFTFSHWACVHVMFFQMPEKIIKIL